MSFVASSHPLARGLPLLLASTLCGLGASAAQAQSSVQMYGLLDLSAVRFAPASGSSLNRLDSGNMSTSYLGIKGTEDLGGGLSAKFSIESFMRNDSGEAGRFGGDAYWARSSWAGLSGGFGSISLGRNTTSLFVSTLIFNPFGDSFGFAPSIRHYFTSSTVTGDTGWSDSISYSSPNLGGLSVQLQAASGEGNGGKNVGGHVLYFGGAFAGTLAYQKVTKGATVDDTTTSQVGLSYNFDVAKLFLQSGKVSNDSTGKDYKINQLGASVPVGAGQVLVSVGMLKPSVGNKKTSSSLGYDYNFSKRTDLYVVVMGEKVENVSGQAKTFGVGLRHKF